MTDQESQKADEEYFQAQAFILLKAAGTRPLTEGEQQSMADLAGIGSMWQQQK